VALETGGMERHSCAVLAVLCCAVGGSGCGVQCVVYVVWCDVQSGAVSGP